MKKKVVIGVMVTDRLKNAANVQKVLTEHGCNIKTRLGLHDVGENVCSPGGLLILELFGKDSEIQALEGKLRKIMGLEVKKMVFKG